MLCTLAGHLWLCNVEPRIRKEAQLATLWVCWQEELIYHDPQKRIIHVHICLVPWTTSTPIMNHNSVPNLLLPTCNQAYYFAKPPSNCVINHNLCQPPPPSRVIKHDIFSTPSLSWVCNIWISSYAWLVTHCSTCRTLLMLQISSNSKAFKFPLMLPH